MPNAFCHRLLLLPLLLTTASSAFGQPVLPPNRNLLEELKNNLDEDRAKDDDPIAPEKAVSFSLRADDLAVGTDLQRLDGTRTIHIRGMEGFTRVTMSQRARGGIGLVPYFELNHTGAANEDGTGAVQTMISSYGGSVRMTRTVRIGDRYDTISLLQDTLWRRNGNFEPRPDRVRMSIRSNRANQPGAAIEDYKLSASNFTELLRRNPGPTARYLAPIFREFGQDVVIFRVDPRIAWQLFPNAAEVDQAMTSKVMGLLDRLDDDDFRAREVASAELELIGGPALLVLSEVDRDTLSPEQNTRFDAIVARYRTLDEEEVEALRNDAEYLLRCFIYSDVPAVRAAAISALRKRLGDSIELGLDPTVKLPARVKAADALRGKIPPDP